MRKQRRFKLQLKKRPPRRMRKRKRRRLKRLRQLNRKS